MTADALDAAMSAVTRGYEPLGIVCGTGFEDRPELLDILRARTHLRQQCRDGSAPQGPGGIRSAVPRLRGAASGGFARAPIRYRGLARQAHRRRRVEAMFVAAAARDAANFYYQRRVPGEGVSALFLSDGKTRAGSGV